MSRPTPPRFDIVRHQLSNGLRVVLQPDHTLPLVAANLWYHVGSKNEGPGQTGLAHLFEHMLFQGSAHVGVNEHFGLVQQAGGTANGSTWFDRTNYYETLPSSHLDLALWLESDRMGYLLPALDSEKLENQRQVVMNERRERIDNQPYGRAFERLHELLYPEHHPYHWPVIGYMKDIEGATLEEVASFFETYYAPNNAVLTLAGDLHPDSAIQRVEHYFGPIPAGEPIPALAIPEIGEASSHRHEVMPDAVQLGRLYLGGVIAPFGDREWYAADLLTTALAAGKSSPLYRDLVYERQIATDVSAFALPTEVASTLVVVATARPGRSVAELEGVVRTHLREIGRSGPRESDLRRAHNKLVTALTDQFQKLDDRADLLSMFTTFFDRPQRIDDEVAIYASLERSELIEFAQRRLHPDQLVSLHVVPRSNR